MASALAPEREESFSTARPSSSTPRALRVWGVSDAIYGVAIAAIAGVAVPWKSPAFNLAIIIYSVALVGGAPFLYRGRRWAYLLALVTGLVGLSAAIAIAVALVASWAYLRASYGVFGAGASLGALLIAGVVIEVLALYPALRLHGLLRREIRLAMRVGRAPIAATLALVLLPVPVGAAVHLRQRLVAAPESDGTVMAAALQTLRAGITETRAPAADPAGATSLATSLPPGRFFVTAWHDGQAIARVEGGGATFAEAVAIAGRRLRAALEPLGGVPPGARLKIDRVLGQAPVVTSLPLAFALALDPGLDGLVDSGGRLMFLGDDVLRAGAAAAATPLAFLDELRLGMDVAWMNRRIRDVSGQAPFSRIRTEGWVETSQGARRVYRGNVDKASSDPRDSRDPHAAAIAGGDYLLRQVETDGRFRYRYHPYDDERFGDAGAYSLARHAGVAYCFAQLFGVTGDPRFSEGAQHALAWMAQQVFAPCGPGKAGTACLQDGGRVAFGPSALASIAMFEYQRRTKDARYQETAIALVTFLASLQKSDGSFEHAYDFEHGRVVPSPPRMFASEQAALALVLAGRVTGAGGGGRWQTAAARALDHLTLKKYDFFLGRFIYGADHWTCIAAEEAWPDIKAPHHWEFCRGYAAFMRRLQYPPAPAASPRDFAGHFGFGYQLVPQAPATAGFTEALLSTLALARHHGAKEDARWLEADARAALSALLREQLSSDNTYLVRAPARAAGGFRRSTVEPEIRIDFVQHATSALARARGLGLSTL
jgi:hypothetical protein